MIILGALAMMVFIVFTACGIGLFFSRTIKIKYHSLLEALVYSTGLGLVAIIYLVFLIGIFGYLQQGVVLTLLIGLGIFGVFSYRSTKEVVQLNPSVTNSPGNRFLQIIAIVYIAILIIIYMVGAFAPDLVWDAHSYSLNIPKRWIQNESLVTLHYIFPSNWPLNMSILYSVGMLFIADSIVPQLTHFLMGILSLGLVFTYTRQKYGGNAALISSMVFYSISTISWLSGTALSELGVTFFTLFAMITFLRYIEVEDRRWLILSGIGIGAALGTKIHAIFGFGVYGTLFLIDQIVSRRSWKTVAINLAILGSTVLLIAGPWYLRSYIERGNPIFPFGYSIFGGKYWNETVDTIFLQSQYSARGVGREIVDYFTLPIRLLKRDHFPHAGYISWIFIPTLIWALFNIKKRTSRYLSLFAILFFIFWVRFSSQQARNLLPALGTLSILTGAWVTSNADWLNRKVRAFERDKGESKNQFFNFNIPVFLTCLIASIVIIEGAATVWKEKSLLLPDQISIATGKLPRETYLRRWFYLSDVMRFMNEELPTEGAVFSYNEIRVFLSDREAFWGHQDLQRFVDFDQLTTRKLLLERFDEIDVQYIMVNNREFPTEAEALDVISDDMHLIFDRGKVLLYSLRDSE